MLGGPLSSQHGTSMGCGWRDGLQLWRVAANILNKQLRTYDKGWSSSLRVGRGATTLHHKNKFVMEISKQHQTWTNYFDK
jgi:hypothetical protein